MTTEELKEEIWKRYGNFELSHEKNKAIVKSIHEFILKERTEAYNKGFKDAMLKYRKDD